MKKTILIGLGLLLIFTQCNKQEDSQQLHAFRLHHEILTLDSHTDTPLNLLRPGWDIGVNHPIGDPRSGQLDLPRIKRGGLDAAFFAVFIPQGERTPEAYERASTRTDELIRSIRAVYYKYPQQIDLAISADHVRLIAKHDMFSLLIGLENGYPIGNNLSRLAQYYQWGVRYITLCHTSNNHICDSSTDKKGPEWNGLSPFGEEMVREMNCLGLMIDVSHASDQAFFDVLDLSQTPVIASHSNCRTLFDHPRNLTDDMLLAIAENGGVVQLNLCSFYLKELASNPKRQASRDSLRKLYGNYYWQQDPIKREAYLEGLAGIDQQYPADQATVQDLVDHIDHAVRIAGIDHVGIGSDFDGGAGLADVQDVSQFPLITLELVKRG
ncbi:membrane dipeptidase, partial [candidate division KSB1 bacterium]|nr:membrane dipeptidase [candidate division KSB1 bacterium]